VPAAFSAATESVYSPSSDIVVPDTYAEPLRRMVVLTESVTVAVGVTSVL